MEPQQPSTTLVQGGSKKINNLLNQLQTPADNKIINSTNTSLSNAVVVKKNRDQQQSRDKFLAIRETNNTSNIAKKSSVLNKDLMTLDQ